MHFKASVERTEGLYSGGLMRLKSAQKSLSLALGGLLLSFCSSAIAYEKEEPKTAFSLNDLVSFIELTKDLNRLSQHQKIPFQIRGLDQKMILMAEPQFPLSQPVKQKGKEVLLPELSTDPTRINPLDLSAFNLFTGGTTKEVQNPGILPIPQARVISPIGEQSAKDRGALDAPLKTQEQINNPDVISGFTPQNTRFGKDRYDTSLFATQSNSKNNLGDPTQTSFNNQPGKNFIQTGLTGSSAPDDEEKKKNKEQEARESFQQTMKEFAERTEEKEAFGLVDYYDLKNVLAKHESILPSFEDDEFDGRFLKNARTIFDRFSEKDNADDKKPFERFLKRMQPPEDVFRSQDLRRNAFPQSKSGQTHRQQSSK